MRALGELARTPPEEAVERALALAREQLGMDVAFVSEFTVEGTQRFWSVDGDGGSFCMEAGAVIPLRDAICRRVLPEDGGSVAVVADAKNDERLKGLDVVDAAGVGSYVGVPLRFSDGRTYGTLCCLSHGSEPSLRERDAGFMSVLARLVAEHLEREELQRKNQRLVIEATGVGALLAALEARDGYTGEHSEAVVDLVSKVCARLGLPPQEATDAERAAKLHDVGKIGVPDAVLNKRGGLDEREMSFMHEHPAIGERIVASTEGIAHLAPVVRAEHEHWDGSGYPDGLAGEQIPLASRIVFACDAFHAMVSDRPYRRAIGVEEALAEVRRNAGTQFDPEVARALVSVVLDAAGEESRR